MRQLSELLETERVEGQSHYQRTNRYGYAYDVEIEAAIATGDASLIEGFEAQFSDVASLARVTSRGLSRSDLIIESDIHSLDLTWMDSASVVSAGGWGSPSVDSLSANLDAHCVSRFDRLNDMPTSGDSLEWISNADTFIKDFYLGMYEEQVGRAYDKSSPRQGEEVSFKTSGDKSFNDQGEHDHPSYRKGEPDGSRTVKDGIAHFKSHIGIFSQQPGLEGLHA